MNLQDQSEVPARVAQALQELGISDCDDARPTSLIVRVLDNSRSCGAGSRRSG
jgi:hypothetical protein